MSNYKTGDKFIIELGEQVGNLFKVKGFNALVFDEHGLNKLGQLVQGVDQFSYRKGAEKGAEEAWELATKIVVLSCNGGFSGDEMREIFNSASPGLIMKNHGYARAKAMVEAWEKAKKAKEEVLKPCPFCGETKTLVFAEEEGSTSGYVQVICDFNKGGCGSASGFRRTEKEARKLWNERGEE